jgi:hypothetical protein
MARSSFTIVVQGTAKRVGPRKLGIPSCHGVTLNDVLYVVANKTGSSRWLPAAAWALFIFLTSSTYIPSKRFVRGVVTAGRGHVDSQWFEGFWREWWWLFVKGYHVLEYFILTTLILRAISATRFRVTALGMGLAFLYASSDEWHQTFVKDRGGKWTDVAIDCIGIALAGPLTVFLAKLTGRRLSRAQNSVPVPR